MKQIQRGFTLMELMVTVAILAILAAIAMPLYSGYVTAGYTAECKNEVAAIKLAEEEYYLENNQYFPAVGSSVTMTTSSTYPNPIEQASGATIANPTGGTYVSSYTSTAKIAKARCTYKVTANAASPYYTITATGVVKNGLPQKTIAQYIK